MCRSSFFWRLLLLCNLLNLFCFCFHLYLVLLLIILLWLFSLLNPCMIVIFSVLFCLIFLILRSQMLCLFLKSCLYFPFCVFHVSLLWLLGIGSHCLCWNILGLSSEVCISRLNFLFFQLFLRILFWLLPYYGLIYTLFSQFLFLLLSHIGCCSLIYIYGPVV